MRHTGRRSESNGQINFNREHETAGFDSNTELQRRALDWRYHSICTRTDVAKEGDHYR